MNAMLDSLLSAPGWGGLTDGQRPLAYGLAAAVCLLLGTSPGLAQRTPARLQQLWLGLGALYLLVAASTLVQADRLWVQWARDFAREQHLYEMRRIAQLATLLGLIWVVSAVWQQQQRGQRLLAAQRGSGLRGMLLTGGLATLTLYLLRFVSFHYTDLALNTVLLNYSVATWVEGAGLGLVTVGTGLELLRSYGHV